MAYRTNKVQRKGHKEQIKKRENKQINYRANCIKSKWYIEEMAFSANSLQSKWHMEQIKYKSKGIQSKCSVHQIT